MRRWKCPQCSSGVNAPERPRKNDVRRFCFACSRRTGFLVERSCPSLDGERARAKARSKARSDRAADRQRKRNVVNGVNVRAEWRALVRLPSVRRVFTGREPELANVRRSRTHPRTTSGHARLGVEAVVTIGVDCDRAAIVAVLAHELAHLVVWTETRGAWHSPIFWECMARLLEERFGPRAYCVPNNGTAFQKHQAIETRLRETLHLEGVR